ncbi:MAG: glycosyltransferase [Candidatus Edwardsbacteria bacterium]|nr:glycosyltransferase [Candidatus Edwardsbacteria bacterium]MBU2593447.1 glycosyltransferase [Candidatus Edwardsbacteria bacterium]
MNILHIIANLAPRYGGPSKACLEMARAVASRGHRVSVYTTNQDGDGVLPVSLDRPVIDNGVEIRYFPIQHPKFWGTSLPLGLALRRDLPSYDIIHIHSLYLFHDLTAGHFCRKYRVPYIIRPHGTLDPYLYKRHRLRKKIMELLFENRNIKGAAALHYTTEEEMLLAKPYVFNSPGIVVPNGLNLAEYEKLPPAGTFRHLFPRVGDSRMVLFLGRLNFKKGFDLLVPAFAKTVKAFPDIHLVIAGPDNDGYGAKVRGWLKEYGLLDKTTFTGMLEGRDKLAAFRDAEIFILPSYTENFGISVLEAMACGVPVVVSDKVNIWREIKGAGAGLVVPTEPESLAEAISVLLDDQVMAKQMGQAGQKLVRENYQWSMIGQKLEKVYKAIIDL